jgi:transcription initiation factor TFIIIB Brf1 subunit/transcription initiation factor TFIIB
MENDEHLRSQLALFEKEIKQYAEALNLSRRTSLCAQDILEKAQQRGITDIRNLTHLVAASLYIACILENERRTQKAISEVTHVSLSTIHHKYRELVYTIGIRQGKT